MKKRLICIFIVVLVSFSVTIYMFLGGFSEAADIYAGTEANMLLTHRVNQSIYRKISEDIPKYEDFALIQKDTGGKVSAIFIDSIKLNLIASELVMTIIESIREIEYGEFAIPIGNAFNSRLFSGRGPKIKIRVVPLGTVASDIKSVFKSAGINQSLHRILLEFRVCVSLMTPFYDSSSEFTASLCIAETVIVGEVPNVIWGLGNASGNLKGDN